jgi:hypothetical protein
MRVMLYWLATRVASQNVLKKHYIAKGIGYCPQLGVMLGTGDDFDDNPRMYTPKCLQLLTRLLENEEGMGPSGCGE